MLTAVSGFLAQAGFTHSLTPARNCTFGCTYCYVPSLRIYGGLKPEDWQRWGQFTTFKPNAAQAVLRKLRPDQRIYCSPLVDPYQPAEEREYAMPEILQAVIARPPAVFVIQTRGPLVLRDLALLRLIPNLRVSFSVSTDREDVRKLYEPHCVPIEERWRTVRALRQAGIAVYATLAPLLPCDPEHLMASALDATANAVIADPLHVRATKARGATTREAALLISQKNGFAQWHDPLFQQSIVSTMERVARQAGRQFGIGPAAFGWLAQR
jgi:DNA repair photolyase